LPPFASYDLDLHLAARSGQRTVSRDDPGVQHFSKRKISRVISRQTMSHLQDARNLQHLFGVLREQFVAKMATPEKRISAGYWTHMSASPYWNNFAAVYRAFGLPLVPTQKDLRFMEGAVEGWACSHPGENLRALLLGVTPGIARMQWPEGSLLVAIDHSIGAASNVWPGNIPGRRWVVCGDWLALPIGAPSSVVIGDGILNCLSYGDFRRLAASVRDTLSDEGIFVLRTFVQADQREDPEVVFLDRFECSTFHHFKLRLMMAMQRGVEQGIPVNEVYRFWCNHNVDREALSLRTGWARSDIDTIDLQNGQSTVFTFPTLHDLRSLLAEYFGEIATLVPSYPGGDRCPTMVLRPDGFRLKS
jgi:hypothetical protein